MSNKRKDALHLKIDFVNQGAHEMGKVHQFSIEEVVENGFVDFGHFILATPF